MRMQPIRKTRQQPGQMEDLAMRAAHGAKAMVFGKETRQLRIDGTSAFDQNATASRLRGPGNLAPVQPARDFPGTGRL
jgi:hypothetical protein